MPNTAAQLALYPDASTAHQIVVERPVVDAAKLSSTIYRAVFQSLDGPMGVKPADMIAALGALAGYSARWMVIRQIANGQIEDDFAAPKGCNMPFVSTSNHVNQMITDLTRDSFAGVLTNSMMAAGAGWLPNVNADVNHNFVDINGPEFPDYSVNKQYWPDLPPQALLLMMWESQARILAHTAGAEDVALDAYALAITRTAAEYKEDLPMDRAGQIALETAIAMAKLKYAF
ncbi:MAG: hypothetical protein AAF870_02610 [Pseudomonadota bacterium]